MSRILCAAASPGHAGLAVVMRYQVRHAHDEQKTLIDVLATRRTTDVCRYVAPSRDTVGPASLEVHNRYWAELEKILGDQFVPCGLRFVARLEIVRLPIVFDWNKVAVVITQ